MTGKVPGLGGPGEGKWREEKTASNTFSRMGKRIAGVMTRDVDTLNDWGEIEDKKKKKKDRLCIETTHAPRELRTATKNLQ